MSSGNCDKCRYPQGLCACGEEDSSLKPCIKCGHKLCQPGDMVKIKYSGLLQQHAYVCTPCREEFGKRQNLRRYGQKGATR